MLKIKYLKKFFLLAIILGQYFTYTIPGKKIADYPVIYHEAIKNIRFSYIKTDLLPESIESNAIKTVYLNDDDFLWAESLSSADLKTISLEKKSERLSLLDLLVSSQSKTIVFAHLNKPKSFFIVQLSVDEASTKQTKQKKLLKNIHVYSPDQKISNSLLGFIKRTNNQQVSFRGILFGGLGAIAFAAFTACSSEAYLRRINSSFCISQDNIGLANPDTQEDLASKIANLFSYLSEKNNTHIASLETRKDMMNSILGDHSYDKSVDIPNLINTKSQGEEIILILNNSDLEKQFGAKNLSTLLSECTNTAIKILIVNDLAQAVTENPYGYGVSRGKTKLFALSKLFNNIFIDGRKKSEILDLIQKDFKAFKDREPFQQDSFIYEWFAVLGLKLLKNN